MPFNTSLLGAIATFSGNGWDLASPLVLAGPLSVHEVAADRPEDLPALLSHLDEVACSGDPDLISAGFLTYEAGVALEGSCAAFRPPVRTPLAAFADFRLTARGGEGSAEREYGGLPVAEDSGGDLSRAEWAAGIQAIRDGIERGDVYQVNLTRRVSHSDSLPVLDLGAALARENPVPFAISFATDGYAVVSNSPELFLDVDLARGVAESRPIKGTIARERDRAADEAARDHLLASAKDASEHLMIVDLVRNDLGRVAEPGGVSVPEFRAVRSFRHLHHLESTVRARLRADVRLSDILSATMPGGSITGAPKRAALEIIRRLEPVPRGPYTGAAGYVRGNGRAIFNIAIRTAILSASGVDYHAGGGIVWDSEAETEWLETETKSHEFAASLAVLSRKG